MSAHVLYNYCCRYTARLGMTGSVSEGTKVGLLDEFDFNLYLEVIGKACDKEIILHSGEVELRHTHPSFNLPKAEQRISHNYQTKYEDTRLSHNYMIGCYYVLVTKALSSPDLFEGLHLYWLEGPERVDKGQQTYHNSWISLLWGGRRFRSMLINIDVVPAIPLYMWPKNARDPTHIQPTASKIASGLVKGWKRDSFRLTFCEPECQILQRACREIRLGYMIIKVLLNALKWANGGLVCEDNIAIKSYHIKTALLYEMGEAATEHKSIDEGQPDTESPMEAPNTEHLHKDDCNSNILLATELERCDIDLAFEWSNRIVYRLHSMLSKGSSTIPQYFLPEVDIHKRIHIGGLRLTQWMKNIMDDIWTPLYQRKKWVKGN